MGFDRLRRWLGGRAARNAADAGSARPLPEGVPVPKHFGDLWAILQEIAREESPETFASKEVALHAAETLEGKKDVDRWLHVYLKRLDPAHDFRFPSHHRRHRGYCLIPRHWPSGTLWEAFDDDTFLRAPVPPQRSREELEAAIDAFLADRVRDDSELLADGETDGEAKGEAKGETKGETDEETAPEC